MSSQINFYYSHCYCKIYLYITPTAAARSILPYANNVVFFFWLKYFVSIACVLAYFLKPCYSVCLGYWHAWTYSILWNVLTKWTHSLHACIYGESHHNMWFWYRSEIIMIVKIHTSSAIWFSNFIYNECDGLYMYGT